GRLYPAAVAPVNTNRTAGGQTRVTAIGRGSKGSAADASHALEVVGRQDDCPPGAARPPEVDRDAQLQPAHVVPPATRNVDRVSRLQLRDLCLDSAQARETSEVWLLDVGLTAVREGVEQSVGIDERTLAWGHKREALASGDQRVEVVRKIAMHSGD